ncbi:DUF5302 domain-containing protein [Streptosporangium sp. KLBMP 9127]|nr:DUF5302 domain-containing protein [Streptosporangium sp. KLBMP 9127]
MATAESQPEGLPEEVAGEVDPDDELKRKFREALEAKRNSQAEANAKGGPQDRSKVHGTHGPAGNRRSFRRKSGG